jgi:tetratricopeptide (TPR) repeat protein/predicted AlkP superfamily pyrophosphatase or phosphodiesterase
MKFIRGLALLLALLGAGCAKPKTSRVMVLGLDGMDPQTVDLLMSEGKLPNFARLRQDGAYGPLLSAEPLLSPIIWTTIATGKTPDQHRIGHFVATNDKTGEQFPVTSSMRKVKALWNILSDSGRRVASVGWWATWPAEKVNGSMVSDHFAYHFLFGQGLYGDDKAEGKTSPPNLVEKLEPLVKRPQDLTPAEMAPFIHVSADEFVRPFDLEDDLSGFKWALSTAITYRNVSLDLWKKEHPDTLLTYIEGTDSTAHLFGHLFRASNLSGELAEQQKRYGGAVEAMYVFADQLVGDYMAAMDRTTTLVVLSDHGFELGILPDDPSKLRSMRRVSEKYHRLRGILYMYGAHVKGHTRLDNPSILDIAPTVLTLNGVAPARDMSGRVLTEALDLKAPARVASYESGRIQTAEAGAPPASDSRVDPEIMKKLTSLGYLQPSSPSGDRNIAAILFEQGKYAEAAAAYAKLVKEKPDDGATRASLAGALGAMGRYDLALKELDAAIRLQPLNPEAYHNRAVIHERQGDKKAAIADYQTAVRYNPEYQASRQALARLGVNPAPERIYTADERRAMDLANEASGLARRGDYPAAMKRLDEAARLAPRLALVYQYRSNVAYFKGDTKEAIAALRKGLEIEPDNALFSENLRKLLEPKPR